MRSSRGYHDHGVQLSLNSIAPPLFSVRSGTRFSDLERSASAVWSAGTHPLSKCTTFRTHEVYTLEEELRNSLSIEVVCYLEYSLVEESVFQIVVLRNLCQVPDRIAGYVEGHAPTLTTVQTKVAIVSSKS